MLSFQGICSCCAVVPGRSAMERHYQYPQTTQLQELEVEEATLEAWLEAHECASESMSEMSEQIKELEGALRRSSGGESPLSFFLTYLMGHPRVF